MDWWIGGAGLFGGLVLLLVGPCVLLVGVTQQEPPAVVMGTVLVLLSGLVLSTFFICDYELTPTDLLARCGPVRFRVPLEQITAVKARPGLRVELGWSLAWSLDRILIRRLKENGRPAWPIAIAPRTAPASCASWRRRGRIGNPPTPGVTGADGQNTGEPAEVNGTLRVGGRLKPVALQLARADKGRPASSPKTFRIYPPGSPN